MKNILHQYLEKKCLPSGRKKGVQNQNANHTHVFNFYVWTGLGL